MIFILSDEACKDTFTIKGELHKYLVKVRRHSIGDEIYLRSKSDIKMLHKYKIINIDPRSLDVKLISSNIEEIKSKKNLHIGWCVIDSNSIEKVLPSLNEIGVDKISFIHCDRSQKNFKLDFKRFERILEASMQQCGRSSYIEFDTYSNIQDFISEHPETKVFDFCDKTLDDCDNITTVLIGCEGGFSQNEKEFLSSQDVFRLNTPMVLRSESAVLAVASKVLI